MLHPDIFYGNCPTCDKSFTSEACISNKIGKSKRKRKYYQGAILPQDSCYPNEIDYIGLDPCTYCHAKIYLIIQDGKYSHLVSSIPQEYYRT